MSHEATGPAGTTGLASPGSGATRQRPERQYILPHTRLIGGHETAHTPAQCTAVPSRSRPWTGVGAYSGEVDHWFRAKPIAYRSEATRVLDYVAK